MENHRDTGWDTFFYWARKFREMADFDTEERDYKLEIARLLTRAREVLVAGESDWAAALGRAFKMRDNNIVIHYSWSPFLRWVDNNAEEAGSALSALWTGDGSDLSARIDTLAGLLGDAGLNGRGVRLNLVAFLLGAIDPIELPNYRVTVVDLACELAQSPAPAKDLTPGGAYGHALQFFDEIIRCGREHGINVRDRLDAQSLAFCVTFWQEKPKHGWGDDAEWADLLEFRTVPSKLRKAAATRPAPRMAKPRIAPMRAPCPLCGYDDDVSRIGPLGNGQSEYVCEGEQHHIDPYHFPYGGE